MKTDPDWKSWAVIALVFTAIMPLQDGTSAFREDWLVWILFLGVLMTLFYFEMVCAYRGWKVARDQFEKTRPNKRRLV